MTTISNFVSRFMELRVAVPPFTPRWVITWKVGDKTIFHILTTLAGMRIVKEFAHIKRLNEWTKLTYRLMSNQSCKLITLVANNIFSSK